MYEELTVDAARKYHEATSSIGFGAARRFVKTVDLGGRRHLLDLGGGSGAYSITAVERFEGLQATVLDLPPVVVATKEYIDDAGVSDRVDTVGADFTVGEFPGPVDVVVMASNLPIYDGNVIAGVVARAFRALEPGGEMHLIGEMLTDDRTGPIDAAMWGMNELICGSLGRSHTEGECAGYFEEAGFANIAVTEFVPGVLFALLRDQTTGGPAAGIRVGGNRTSSRSMHDRTAYPRRLTSVACKRGSTSMQNRSGIVISRGRRFLPGQPRTTRR